MARYSTEVAPQRFVRDPEALWRRTIDQVAILSSEADDAILLGASGPHLWDLLSQPRSLDELVAGFTETFTVPASVIEEDLGPILEQLIDAGAVRRVVTG